MKPRPARSTSAINRAINRAIKLGGDVPGREYVVVPGRSPGRSPQPAPAFATPTFIARVAKQVQPTDVIFGSPFSHNPRF